MVAECSINRRLSWIKKMETGSKQTKTQFWVREDLVIVPMRAKSAATPLLS